ncbi:OLC1v1021007C1 [Oldenlandia corymbosa var. corymbosa]|uniref:OLC1v1021007C1 n=1 Tax=Oldenlandia corymbosa var. corymbosa TaxID=529605 RepID=A0AAV1BX68_OLDCO|nr:OLC1v1021007C1 [Oldenlandia corymbosa var. corymbosa]
MAGGGPGNAPKILLAKPPAFVNRPGGGLPTSVAGAAAGGAAEDDSAAAAASRSRPPSIGSLNLLSDSWDFNPDRFLPFLTDNTDFMVVGVIGPVGVGKSTIMNQIYGFDPSSPGMLPPFPVQSEETRAMTKHCTIGIEPRVSSERIILLDTQPVSSPSVLAEMIRPDGSSTISVLSDESSLSAELAYELMNIQVDLLKLGIPEPSSVSLSHPQSTSLVVSEKEIKDKTLEFGKEYLATPVFVQTKLREQDVTPQNYLQLKKALNRYFRSSYFKRFESHNHGDRDTDSTSSLELFLLPSKNRDNSPKPSYESHECALRKLRNQVLSMSGSSSFTRIVSERDWIKNSAKVWDVVKNSSIIMEYCRMLQSSGMFRR